MEKINLICLHGFLGKPSDWDLLHSYFVVSPLGPQTYWWSVDYMSMPQLTPNQSLQGWGEAFEREVQKKFPNGRRVLLGYSLGGRLALHALAQNSDAYDAAIFLSTNPGLERVKDKQERQSLDQQWATKFLEMSWDELMKEWNGQGVFKESRLEPKRNAADYDRAQLAAALTSWSLSKQDDFREVIRKNSMKTLWCTGEKDIKYLSLAMDLQKKAPGLSTAQIRSASHRLIFDNPPEVAAELIRFLQEVL